MQPNTTHDRPGAGDPVTDVCDFPGVPASVRQAWAWVSGLLADPDTAADAALMTSELFTNAIKFTASCLPGGVVKVIVRTGHEWVRVDVFDEGPVYPCFPVPGGLGLGLVLVRQLAKAVGSDGADKWFTLRTGRAAGTTSDQGAQPSGRQAERITICCYCRKRVYRQKDGTWYHYRNGSTSCRPGEGSDRATPLEIEAGK